MTQNNFVKNAVNSFNKRKEECKSKFYDAITLTIMTCVMYFFLSMVFIFGIWPDCIKYAFNPPIIVKILFSIFAFAIVLCLYGLIEGMNHQKKFGEQFSQSRLKYIEQEIREYMNDRNNWVDEKCSALLNLFLREDLSPLNREEQDELIKWITDEWPN